MRRFVLLSVAVAAIIVAIGVAVGMSVHWADATAGMTLSIDGETFEGPAVAALLGCIAAFGAAIVCLALVAVVASVAIVFPVLLVLLVTVVLGALVVGLSPVLVPVLLVLGAYGLLSRSRRRASSVAPPNAAPSSAVRPDATPANGNAPGGVPSTFS